MSPKPKVALGVHLPEAPLLRCKEEDVVSTMAIDTPLQSPTLSESTVPFSSPSTLRADSGWSTPALAQPTSWRGTQNVGHPVFEDVHTPQGGTLDNDWNGSPVSSTHHPISSWDLSDSPLSHLHQLYTDEFPCWQYRFPPTNRDLSSSQSPHSSGGHTTKPAREHPQTHAESCPSSTYTRSVAVHTNSFFGLQSAEDRSASVFATTVQAVSVSHFHSDTKATPQDDSVLFDFIPSFTFPPKQRLSHSNSKPTPKSTRNILVMDASRQSTPPTHSSQPRQRPEIPSIGKLSSWSAPRSSFSAPSFNLQPTTPISQTEQYYVPSFGGGASQLGSSLPSMVPSFMHPSEVEEPAYSSQARWLTPEPEPRTPAFGPATSNRRRSASTGALPSTYSTSPYSIPATVPGPDFISQEEERLRVIDQTRSLWDLQDASEGPHARPNYSLTTLIRYAILGSEAQRLTLQEIYEAIEQRYAFFATAGKGWKNSVRHNLSLNKCFKRVNRTLLDPGKGSYWYVDLNEEFSTPRHRNRKKQDGASGRGRSSSESFSPGPEPQQGQVATVPEEWVDTDGITHGHAPSDALQPEPIASRLVKTRPRSLSDFTFPSRGAEYHQSNYGEQSHESYPALEPFHGGSSHQDSFQFSNYRYMSEPPTSGQSSTPITEIAAPQPIQPQPNFYSLMQQALQVSSLESSKDSYRPNNQGFAF